VHDVIGSIRKELHCCKDTAHLCSSDCMSTPEASGMSRVYSLRKNAIIFPHFRLNVHSG
jgi:hypothetical protein